LDQLEELLTVSDREEAAVAVQELVALAATGLSGIRVVATIRGDFLSRLASATPLGEELPRFLYFLRPLPAERVREGIVGPAEVTGTAFESEPMIETLAGAMANAEGGLPLLQFALAQLWDSRDRGRRIIPEAALAALGGVAGALARHAEGVLQTLLPAQ